MTGLPTQRACQLQALPAERRWLIEGLWAHQGVGIVGGEPKCYKSFLALDIAVAVASGADCLRRYRVAHRGPVLLFAAEDALHTVRQRLEGIARAADADFAELDIHVITASTVRLDLPDDRQRLHDTVAALRPRLLVLDPFVRLHRIDENAAAEVAPLLAYLRELQRQFHAAVLLVHHARKGGHARAGQALRGSSELHAWGDSNLYLRREREQLWLSIEQRAAASTAALAAELHADGEALALRILDRQPPTLHATPKPAERILAALASTSEPMTRRALRDACRIRTASVGEALAVLIDQGAVVERADRYTIA
ncbi:MAG: AAA family ATPase [Gammaproteobacteria bacterium]